MGGHAPYPSSKTNRWAVLVRIKKSKIAKLVEFVHEYLLQTILSLFQIFIYMCKQANNIHTIQMIKYETIRSR